MKLVCILLLLSLVLLHLPSVKDADDGSYKEASAHQCPACHEHRLAGRDEQLAYPKRRVFPWVGNDYQLGIGDDLGEAATQGLRVVPLWDANLQHLHKVPVSPKPKDSVWQLQGMVGSLGELSCPGLL